MNVIENQLTADDFADGLLSISEVADFCRVSTREVYRLMESHEMPWTKVGRCRKVPRRALLRWLARDRQYQ